MYGFFCIFLQKMTNIFHSANTESECSSDYVIKMCDFVYFCTRICTFCRKTQSFQVLETYPYPFVKGDGRVKVVEHSAFKSSFVANKHPQRFFCKQKKASGNFLALYLIQCLPFQKEEDTAYN